MTSEGTARNGMLARIRSANEAMGSAEALNVAWDAIARDYDHAARPPAEAIELLTERLRDYDAEVEHVAESDLPRAVAALLAKLGITQVLLPPGMAPLLRQALPEARVDEEFSATELATFSCVVTEATLGIAETGTLVLQNRPGQGRRAVSLVPDVHLCILRAVDVVATVPEAIRRLQDTKTLPTTFISGPSATADIEMTRIKGVHGPRFLHVLIAR
jgi:L-lactate dehydrogenase complex protein LldG